jgi:predicted MPP superfamily phosphohydrolase
MRNARIIWIILGIMIVLDLYVFQAIKVVGQNLSQKTKMFLFGGYWSISIIVLVFLALLPFLNFFTWPANFRNYLFAIILGLFFAKLFASVLFLLDDIRRAIQWASGKLFFRDTEGESLSEGISRSVFLSWLGLGIGGGLFSTLMYGFTNKYNYKIRRFKLVFENLPASFKGLKIVQISDIHSGSFTNKSAVRHGVDMVMRENADLILFTGDLVNDRAVEMQDYMDVFNQVKAPMGVYSILGNHDYGDYYYGAHAEGEVAVAKTKNLEHLKQIHAQLGWRLLLDEHVALEKNNEKIALIGVQNISGRRTFHSYGSLSKAYAGAETYPFKILMSHDPSHWDKEVTTKYTDIDLTLSGHTHGMQFGVELPGFKWSPVQYVYKEWAGLYQEGKQRIYVNRGYGFIGYPGRVGILPEITVLELA